MGDIYDKLVEMLRSAIAARHGNVESAAQDVREAIDRMPRAEREKYDQEFARITMPIPPGFREDGKPQ